MHVLIKQINEIMGSDNPGAKLTINFYPDGGIVFGIYEQEIPIIVDKKDMHVFLACELTTDKLTSDMLNELAQITELIEKRIGIVVQCVN